jgi:hypothetical protein
MIKREMTEPEYRALDCISYSQLSGLDTSPGNLIAGSMEMTEPLIYGSAVDCLAFDGKEAFDKKFTVISQDKPSWMLEKVIKGIVDELLVTHNELDGPLSSNLEDHESTILAVAKSVEYGKGWHDPTIVKKVIEGCGELFRTTIENVGKLALDTQQYEYIENSVNILFTHDFTAEYFRADEGQEIYFQLPIVWEYEKDGVIYKCKSLLDIMKIDHNLKKIYPIDLKTTGKSVLAFPGSFIQWKYYLQSSFYTDAVIYLRDKLYPELSDYTVELFKFVVISSKNPHKPLTYVIDQHTLEAGKYGGVIKDYNREVKGYLELVTDMKWHIDNKKYQYPKEVYDNNGLMELKVF